MDGEGLLRLIEQSKLVPAALWAMNEEVYHYLRQLIRTFDLKAYLTDELPALQEAKDGILEHFSEV